jgi:hypothetical protein
MPAVPLTVVAPLVLFASMAITAGVWAALTLVVRPSAESLWWTQAVAVSAGALFAARWGGQSRWARSAVPAFAFNILALQHLRTQGVTLVGAVLIAVAVGMNVLHVSAMRAR